jgi:hypothetical protein
MCVSTEQIVLAEEGDEQRAERLGVCASSEQGCERSCSSLQRECDYCSKLQVVQQLGVWFEAAVCSTSSRIVRSYCVFNKCKYCSKLRSVQQVQVLFKATVCSTSTSIVQSYCVFNKCKYCSKLQCVRQVQVLFKATVCSTSASIVQSYCVFNK